MKLTASRLPAQSLNAMLCLLPAKQTLVQELKRGRGELLKDELMKLVDASGLSNKPIYGNRNSAAKPGEMHYDGWATMNKVGCTGKGAGWL